MCWLFFLHTFKIRDTGWKRKGGKKKQSRAFWLKAEMCLVHHAHTIISAGTRSRSTPGCEMCSLALLFMWSWKYAAHRNFKQSWFWLKQIYSNTCTTKTHSFPSSVYVFISHLNTTQICWKCRGALSLPRSTCFQCHKSSSCCTPTAIKTLVSLNYIVIWVHACCWSTMDRNLRYFLTLPIFQVPWLSFKMLEMWGEESGL